MNPARLFFLLLGYAVLTRGAAAQRPAAAAPAAEEKAPVAAPAAAPAAEIAEPLFEPPPAKAKVAAPANPAAKLGPPNPQAARFRQVRERVDALFRHRNEVPPPFDAHSNPFRGVGAIAPTAATGRSGAAEVPPPAPTNPDLALLQQSAATIKVAGNVEINGRQHLIINQAPYKEGDVIIVRVKGRPVYLRLKEISRLTFTLSLNDSEFVVRY